MGKRVRDGVVGGWGGMRHDGREKHVALRVTKWGGLTDTTVQAHSTGSRSY